MDVPHNASRWTRFKWTTFAFMVLVAAYLSVPFMLIYRQLVGMCTPKKFVGKDFEKVFEELNIESQALICMMVRRYGLEAEYTYFRLPHWHPARMRIVIYRGLFLKFVLTTDQNWI